MKKVLAAVVAVALMITMFAVVSNAAGGICIDGAYLTNDADPSTTHTEAHKPNEGETGLTMEFFNGDIGDVYNSGFAYLHFQGWWSDDEEIADFGYQFNDGEIVWGQLIFDQNLIDVKDLTGHEYPNRFNMTLPLQEGVISFKLYKKYAAGGEEVFHTVTYSNEAGAAVTHYTDKLLSNGAAIGVWVNAGNPTAYVKFTTAGSFKGFSLPIYWASRPEGDNPTGPSATWTAEIFKFAYNTDYTLAQKPVKSVTVTSTADNNPVFNEQWDEALEAGTYIVKFTITNADYVDENNKAPYLVLPQSDLEVSPVAVYSNDAAFTLKFLGEDVEGDFFVANPDEVDTPAQTEVPQTGDASIAMIAVLVVLAMGAAVVFARKKSY